MPRCYSARHRRNFALQSFWSVPVLRQAVELPCRAARPLCRRFLCSVNHHSYSAVASGALPCVAATPGDTVLTLPKAAAAISAPPLLPVLCHAVQLLCSVTLLLCRRFRCSGMHCRYSAKHCSYFAKHCSCSVMASRTLPGPTATLPCGAATLPKAPVLCPAL